MKAMMKPWLSVLAALLLALSLVGCGAGKEQQGETNGTAQEQPAETDGQEESTGQTPASDEGELKTEYPLTVTDATGTEITFEQAPAKIVSLSPSETEKLFALGLDEEIVGVTDYDDYPEAATTKPRMGGFQVNEEALIAAGPDVVFSATMNAETAEQLRGLGITVYVNNPKTIEDVMESILLLGQITDRQAEAGQVVEQMKQELASVTEAVQSLSEEEKKKVYVEFSPGWTVGKGEFMDEMITLAGGINVAGDQEGWFEISEENIIAANPDVILYSANVVDESSQKTLDVMIKERSGWDQIEAIKNDRIVGLDDNLLSRPGPRVTQGLIEVAKAIYPELMNP
ncbi:ABC transporter substrate-binding protein [Paenibacillus campinasensis]|uniref:Cobalamin-binding protein n=1 Tax=Paenibacillus campinasensis TaxID=66347 RepID=A0A268EWZ5_9BACL|nr:ABC transporter substrate-binding protein [Paenibacillus campinasensis]PAD77638.1 cobalamin-binding protein [Paenibacillus campinasensis]